MNSALTQFLSFVLLSPLKCTSVEALPKKDSEGSSVSEQSTIFQILSPQTSQKKFDLASIKIPPYMLDLFKTVADENGKSRKRVKLAGNVVRSFFNEGESCHDPQRRVCWYNHVPAIQMLSYLKIIAVISHKIKRCVLSVLDILSLGIQSVSLNDIVNPLVKFQ